MILKEELAFLSPEPIMVGGEAIFSLTLFQVLGFLSLPTDPLSLERFLKKNHKEVTPELIQLYEISSYLLQVEPDKKIAEKEKAKPCFGGEESLLMTSLIHAVAKEFKMSWSDVLNMWVSHFHLALIHIKNIREREMKEINKRKKIK